MLSARCHRTYRTAVTTAQLTNPQTGNVRIQATTISRVTPHRTAETRRATPAHLLDRVFPAVPVRQWVLSLPHRVRYLLAWDHALCRAVVAVYIRTVLGFLRRRARRAGVRVNLVLYHGAVAAARGGWSGRGWLRQRGRGDRGTT